MAGWLAWPGKIYGAVGRRLPRAENGITSHTTELNGTQAARDDATANPAGAGIWADFARKSAFPHRSDQSKTAKPLAIMVPVDFSEGSDLALNCALEMGAGHETRVTLVHAINLNLAEFGPANPAAQKMSLYEEALGKARPFLEKAQGMGVKASCLFKENSPADAIMAVARQSRPDLIILSRKPHGRLGKWFGRRTVERVVRGSACPVLVLPESC